MKWEQVIYDIKDADTAPPPLPGLSSPQYGFTSKSHGNGDNRRVTVYKARRSCRQCGCAKSTLPLVSVGAEACVQQLTEPSLCIQPKTFRPAHTLDAYDLPLCSASCAALNQLFAQHPPTQVC